MVQVCPEASVVPLQLSVKPAVVKMTLVLLAVEKLCESVPLVTEPTLVTVNVTDAAVLLSDTVVNV